MSPGRTRPPRSKKLAAALRESSNPLDEADFLSILGIIRAGRQRVWTAANTELLELYWKTGQHLSHKVAEGGWGRRTVERLAAWLSSREPGLCGFSASNLWRMRQFYETYSADPILAALVRELPWASNLEALDRNHRKPHEAPSIGVLLCKTRDQDVVEYALSRSLSPALVAEYETRLPDKALLQAKLDELTISSRNRERIRKHDIGRATDSVSAVGGRVFFRASNTKVVSVGLHRVHARLGLANH